MTLATRVSPLDFLRYMRVVVEWQQEHLVGSVVRSRGQDVVQGLLGIDAQMRGHLVDSLRTEGRLGVYPEDLALQTPLFRGELHVHRKLVADLGFARAEFTVELGY